MIRSIHLFVMVFMAVAGSFAQTAATEKVILKNAALYKITATKAYNILEIIDTAARSTAMLKLPAESLPGRKIAFDLHDRFVNAISVVQYAPHRYTAFLVKSDVSKLDMLTGSDTLTIPEYRFSDPKSMESSIAVEPLETALYEARIANLKLNYSLLTLSGGATDLFVLLGDRLTIWQLDQERWKKTFSDTCSVAGEFVAVEHKRKKYVITDTGDVFEVGKKITPVSGKNAGAQSAIIVDKTRDKVYSIPAYGTRPRLKALRAQKPREVF